jgi:hypothetical protein
LYETPSAIVTGCAHPRRSLARDDVGDRKYKAMGSDADDSIIPARFLFVFDLCVAALAAARLHRILLGSTVEFSTQAAATVALLPTL